MVQANPQKENGYTGIANELLEALARFRIPGELRQVLDCLIRKTYGYNKKSDSIANSQIVLMTGMKKGNVSRALSRLITHKIVIRSDNSKKTGNELGINKNYKDWTEFGITSDNKKAPKKKLSKRHPKLSEVITPVIRSDNKTLSEVMDTKDKTISKDTLQKKGDTPSEKAKEFFKGIEDLIAHKTGDPISLEGEKAKLFLMALSEKYPDATKPMLWTEIKKFHAYWTELNASGKKQRWQKQETFMVERRLGTWFAKLSSFQSKNEGKKSNYSPDIVH